MRCAWLFVLALNCGLLAAPLDSAFFQPPSEFKADFGGYSSVLRFADGRPVRTKTDWEQRRNELRREWEREIGSWPPLISHPRVEIVSSTNRETFLQQEVRIEIAPGQISRAVILTPQGQGPFPGVVVPYYDIETSIGASATKLRDFALQLTRRGFVTLSIGSPGGDARKPELGKATCQPLHFLGYVAANCYNVLTNTGKVDPRRVGIVGHSYGGKWAMFAACFFESFACGVWSDPGIVFDEARPNVNYWEPWYLGYDPLRTRSPGLISPANPRTGAYARLVEQGHDLHEVMALMAPRPFLVSGGAEDQPRRWQALNRVNEVYALLDAPGRVAMTTRPAHDPTPESNEQIYAFFTQFLKVP